MDEILRKMIENATYLTTHEQGHDITVVVPRIYHIGALTIYLQNSIIAFLHNVENRSRTIEYVVDIGAHTGLWSITYMIAFPKTDVLAIEPSKYSMWFLQKNLEPFKHRAKIKKLALGNISDHIVTLSCPTKIQKRGHTGDTGMISLYGASDKWREMVPMDKLDNIVTRKVDWIKMDVEGAESLVIEGAKKTIANDRPILQVEMRESNQGMANYSIWELLQDIGKLGYVSVGEIRGDLIFLPREYWNPNENFVD